MLWFAWKGPDLCLLSSVIIGSTNYHSIKCPIWEWSNLYGFSVYRKCNISNVIAGQWKHWLALFKGILGVSDWRVGVPLTFNYLLHSVFLLKC